MEIKPVDLTIDVKKSAKKETAQDLVNSFSDMLQDALSKVNNLQSNSDEMIKKLAAGEIKDLHQVLIAIEEANIALQLTMQVRNKAIEAYQEIMRMQI